MNSSPLIINQLTTNPISYGGLQFRLNDVKNSVSCNSTINGQVQLTVLISVIVDVNNPYCGDNVTCIQEFNTEQLSTIKSFFQVVSSLIPYLGSLSVDKLSLTNSVPDVAVTLLCKNGS